MDTNARARLLGDGGFSWRAAVSDRVSQACAHLQERDYVNTEDLTFICLSSRCFVSTAQLHLRAVTEINF